jgi:methanogenic corrinoid protein MtbC1
MDIQPVTPRAAAAFDKLYPRILALVEERLGLELGKRTPKYGPRQSEFLKDWGERFGETLKAVYSFGLFEQLNNEAAWLVSVLESRGLGREWAEKILESWTIALQGMVKPPEGDELAGPLVRALSLIPQVGGHSQAEKRHLPEEVQRYLDFALGGSRREAAEFALSFLEAGLDPDKIADKILLPALRQAGFLWEKNEIGASTEHLATEITRYVIYRLFDKAPRKKSLPYSAVLACVPGDEHDIGIDLLANLLRSDGWSPAFIGRGSPRQDLLDAVARARPDVVFLSAILIAHLPAAHALILDLKAQIPGVRIILGGAAASAAKGIFEPLVAGIAASLEDGRRTARSLVEQHA